MDVACIFCINTKTCGVMFFARTKNIKQKKGNVWSNVAFN